MATVELLAIGEAADRLGLAPSALRYYDERGLVPAHSRHGGRRMYGPDELRRLAFVAVAQRLRIPLDTAAAVLDAPRGQWQGAVADQVAALDELIAQAGEAQRFLRHALDCPAEHPVRECPVLGEALDHLVDGGDVGELGRRYAPGRPE